MSQRQCLPIDDDDDESSCDSELNFDLHQISALEYLKKVRSQRNRIPPIVTKEIPAGCNSAEGLYDDLFSEQRSKAHELSQTKEWQELQREKFIDIQEMIYNFKNEPNYEDRIMKEIPLDTSEEEECIKYCQENEPLLPLMLALDQNDIEHLMEALANHLSEKVANADLKETTWITKWIYSTLACLTIPLLPEVHSSIRLIAKNCIQIIENYKSSNDTAIDLNELLPFNLLVTIIVKNFHQFDLLSL